MTLIELIAKLEAVRAKHGDLQVFGYDGGLYPDIEACRVGPDNTLGVKLGSYRKNCLPADIAWSDQCLGLSADDRWLFEAVS